MASGNCPPEDEFLSFAQGHLRLERRSALEAHARVCPACEELAGAALAGSGPMASHESSPWRRNPDLPRGTLVGRYTVLLLVGRGAMSEVYAAYDPELDRRVALKLLAADGTTGDPRAEVRLLREARAVARLSHPNVIGVYDAGRFGDRIFVAMEYVEGQTLADWLRQRPRTREEVLAVFGGAARGLAAAHARGLVHRDFKPENVMVAADGTARVADFGLVQSLFGPSEPEPDRPEDGVRGGPFDLALTRPGEMVGTPLYMSPEQLTRRQTDARSDQFSFCVALYQALFGSHPFLGQSERELESVDRERIDGASPADDVVGGRAALDASGRPAWVGGRSAKALAVDERAGDRAGSGPGPRRAPDGPGGGLGRGDTRVRGRGGPDGTAGRPALPGRSLAFGRSVAAAQPAGRDVAANGKSDSRLRPHWISRCRRHGRAGGGRPESLRREMAGDLPRRLRGHARTRRPVGGGFGPEDAMPGGASRVAARADRGVRGRRSCDRSKRCRRGERASRSGVVR